MFNIPTLQKHKILFFILLSLVAVFSLISSVVMYRDLIHLNETSQEEIRKIADKETHKAANLLDARFKKVKDLVFDFEKKLSSGKVWNRKRALLKSLKVSSDLAGAGIAYKKRKYLDNVELYAPYATRTEQGADTMMFLNDIYDYTKEDWYIATFRDGAGWTEPFLEATTGLFLTSFIVPFYKNETDKKQKKNPIGLTFGDFSIDSIKNIMSNLRLGKTGYGYILSKTGVFLSHPISSYVTNQVSIFDLAKQPEHSSLKKISDKLQGKGNKTGIMEVSNEITGQTSWVMYMTIPSTGWTLVTNFPSEELKIENETIRKTTMLLTIFVFLFIFSFLGLLFRIYLFKKSNIPFFFMGALLCFAATITVWHASYKYPSEKVTDATKIVNRVGRNHFLRSQEKLAAERRTEKPIIIPTGLIVQSIEFQGSDAVFVSGYVWQKYTPEQKEKIGQGVVFPDASAIYISDAYQKKLADSTETFGWFFGITIKQPFDYDLYPFDKKDVWIRIEHEEFNKNIILSPDLEAYKLINPSSKPGLDKNMVMPSWEIQESYFSYVPRSYDTNFGLPGSGRMEQSEELAFTVKLRREIVSPLLSILLPFLVIAILMYAQVLATPSSTYDGFMAVSAGLLFTILLTHFTLRTSLEPKGVVYFESFYFILYLFNALTVLNLFAYSDTKENLISKEKNIFAKLIFWPLILFCMLFITILVYY